MYIITESREIINLDHFQGVKIREGEIYEGATIDIEDSQKTAFCLFAIGKGDIDDYPIISYDAYNSASQSLHNLYKALGRGDLVWDAITSVDPHDRKEITLHLGDCLQDMETMHSVSLYGAKLVGTPLQVGMIFAVLSELPGTPDVASGEDLELLKICQKVLKYARECPSNPDGSGYYIDPNKSGA